MTWLREEAGAVTLTLVIQPRAGKTVVAGPHGNALKVRVAAPPVDGAANEALVEFLADAVGVPKSRVELRSGGSGRRKVVRIEGVAANDVRSRLWEGVDP